MKPTHQLLILYTFAMLLGLYVMYNAPVVPSEKLSEPSDIGFMFLLILGFGLALLYLSKYFDIKYFLYLVEIVVFLTAGVFVLSAFFPSWLSYILAAGILAVRFLKPWPWKNVVALLSSVGAGVILGYTITFPMVIALTLLLTIYDFVAVFISKHMILLAQAVLKAEASFTITAGKPVARKAGKMPGLRVDVGTGDIVVPLMITTSAYVWGLNPIKLALASILGFAATMYLLERYKMPLPALPPIVTAMFLSLLL